MNERTIFLTALDKPDPVQRQAWLDASCGGDPGLRRRVEDLLRVYSDAGSFLEHPPLDPGRTERGSVHEDAAGETLGDAGDTPREVSAFDPTLLGAEIEHELSLEFLGPPREPGHLGSLGPYEITELIGRGGMGLVLKGHDTRLNRVVAVKVLAPELASNPAARKRFTREARAAAAVSHDHVVTIHHIDETASPPYLVMEYVAGLSLQQRIDGSGPLEVKEILRIGRQMAAGLAAAHEQGLVHRDIKPANILLENGVERVKITDFGLARAVDDVSMTQTGVVAGTPQYMSPEQAQGQHVDHRSDLFSLGSVLYAMCTGRPPFRADSTIAVIRRVCDDRPRPIGQINAEIPEWLTAILERLLEKSPFDRIQTAREVADLLGQGLAHVQNPAAHAPPVIGDALRPDGRGEAPFQWDEPGRDVMAPASGLTSILTRVSRRHRWAAAALVVLLVVGLVAAVSAGGGLRRVTHWLAGRTVQLTLHVGGPDVEILYGDERLAVNDNGVATLFVSPGDYEIVSTEPDRAATTWHEVGPHSHHRVWISDRADQVRVRRMTDQEKARRFLDAAMARRQKQPPGADRPDAVAGPELRQQWTSLVAAARKATGDAELQRLAVEATPVLGVIGGTSGAELLRLIADLPDATHQQLLAGGYLKWPFGSLDEARQRVFSDLVAEMLKNARQFGFDVKRPVDESARDVLGKADTGFAIIEVPATGAQVVCWYVLARHAPVPLCVPLVGLELDEQSTPESERAFQRAQLEQLLKLTDKPRTELPPGAQGLATVMREFAARLAEELPRLTDEEWQPFRDEFLALIGDEPEFLSAVFEQFPALKEQLQARMTRAEWGELENRYLDRMAQQAVAGLVEPALTEADWEKFRQRSLFAIRELPAYRRTVLRTLKLFDAKLPPDVTDEQLVAEWVRVLRQIGMAGKDSASRGDGRPDLRDSALASPTGDRPVEIARSSRVFSGPLAEGDLHVYALAFTRTGDRAVTGHFGGTLAVWDVAAGTTQRELHAHGGTIHALAISPDGQLLASGGEDSTIRLWNLDSGELVREVPGHTGWVMGLAFRPGGELVSVGWDFNEHRDNTLRVWDIATGAERRRVSTNLLHPRALAMAPDGSWAAVSDSALGRVGLWDLDSGSARHFFGGYPTTPGCVAVSPDGTQLLAGYNVQRQADGKWHDPENAVLRLWDVASGRLLREFHGHSGPVLAVQFSRDGRLALSLASDSHDAVGEFVESRDRSVRVWDVQTGDELVRLLIERAHVAEWLPDGRHICTGTRIWEISRP